MANLKYVQKSLQAAVYNGETNLFCLYADHEPLTFQEAVEEENWRSAMEEEMHAIQKNDTWELATLPRGQKAIGVLWVYKIKRTKRNPKVIHKNDGIK